MNFINLIRNEGKFENLTHSTDEINTPMFGFTLKGKHVYYWFKELGENDWYFDHSYSTNTGATKKRYSCLPESIMNLYLIYSKQQKTQTATDGTTNNMKNTILSAIEIAKDGGVTYNLENGILSNLPFYCISKAQHELEVDELTEDVVRDYVLRHAELLAEDGVCLGMWKDKGKFYLDITDLWDKDEYTEAGALEIGRLRNQKAIFDLESMTEIRCHDLEFCTKDGKKYTTANNTKAFDWYHGLGYVPTEGTTFGFGSAEVTLEELAELTELDRREAMSMGLTSIEYTA
jgi:hypothetical protein